MKVITIVYHKNISSIYKKEWIEKSYKSILNQTYKDFAIYELNYGNDDLKLNDEYPNDKEYKFFKVPFDNHADAMNFLLEKCLIDGADYVFNNNLDDFNDERRFEIQLNVISSNGYDLVSSDFVQIDSNDNQIRSMNMSEYKLYNEIIKDHNIICHPSVCYSRNFLENNKYDSSEIPREDLLLWKRSLEKFRFFICPEFLINYRMHEKQVTALNKEVKSSEEKTHIYFNNESKMICSCGEVKNKRLYNFCQKCSKIY
jgi:hypothetical protein